MLKLTREESVREQIYDELKDEIKENLFWEAGEVFVAVYEWDGEIVADIGCRQRGSFSPDEQYFTTVYKGINESSDVSIDWDLIDDDGNENEEAIESFLDEVMDEINWSKIEKIAKKAWKEYDEEREE